MLPHAAVSGMDHTPPQSCPNARMPAEIQSAKWTLSQSRAGLNTTEYHKMTNVNVSPGHAVHSDLYQSPHNTPGGWDMNSQGVYCNPGLTTALSAPLFCAAAPCCSASCCCCHLVSARGIRLAESQGGGVGAVHLPPPFLKGTVHATEHTICSLKVPDVLPQPPLKEAVHHASCRSFRLRLPWTSFGGGACAHAHTPSLPPHPQKGQIHRVEQSKPPPYPQPRSHS